MPRRAAMGMRPSDDVSDNEDDDTSMPRPVVEPRMAAPASGLDSHSPPPPAKRQQEKWDRMPLAGDKATTPRYVVCVLCMMTILVMVLGVTLVVVMQMKGFKVVLVKTNGMSNPPPTSTSSPPPASSSSSSTASIVAMPTLGPSPVALQPPPTVGPSPAAATVGPSPAAATTATPDGESWHDLTKVLKPTLTGGSNWDDADIFCHNQGQTMCRYERYCAKGKLVETPPAYDRDVSPEWQWVPYYNDKHDLAAWVNLGGKRTCEKHTKWGRPSFDMEPFTKVADDGHQAGWALGQVKCCPAEAPTIAPTEAPTTHVADATALVSAASAASATNPYLAKHVTGERKAFWATLAKERATNAKWIQSKFPGWGNGPESCFLLGAGETLDGPRHWKKFDADISFDAARCKDEKGQMPPLQPGWHNQLMWDVVRRRFCHEQNGRKEATFPMPDELKPALDLNFKGGFDKNSDLKQPPVVMSGGNAVGELPWDPAVVQDHFFKLQAALAVFWENRIQDNAVKTSAKGKQVLVDMFASIFVHGTDFVFGAIGDSTLAGADNCYYDNFLSHMERQIAPFFGAAKIKAVGVNRGRNGGVGSVESMPYARCILGETDLILRFFPFVTGNKKITDMSPDQIDEEFVRQALLSGTLVNLDNSNDKTLFGAYYDLGVTEGLAEVPMDPPGIAKYWANAGKSHWGRVGFGICNTEHTRAGSKAVNHRNWHGGPAAYEWLGDTYLYHWLPAITDALHAIGEALKASGGKLAPLKERWAKPRAPRKASELPARKFPYTKVFDPQPDLPLADCGVGKVAPGPGVARGHVAKWPLSTADAASMPKWDGGASSAGASWSVQGSSGPASPWQIKGGPGTSDEVQPICHPFGFDYSKNPTVYKKDGRPWNCAGPRRNAAACTHQDTQPGYVQTSGDASSWLTLKVERQTMAVGMIGLCGSFKSKSPTFRLSGVGLDASADVTPANAGVGAWGQTDCIVLTKTLSAEARGGEVLIGIKGSGVFSVTSVTVQ